MRAHPYTTIAANVTVLSSYTGAYSNLVDLAQAVVMKITPIFEALWKMVGNLPLPF